MQYIAVTAIARTSYSNAMECAPTSQYPGTTYSERHPLRIELSTITTGSLGSRCALTSSRALLDILDLVLAEGLALGVSQLRLATRR